MCVRDSFVGATVFYKITKIYNWLPHFDLKSIFERKSIW